MLLLFEVLSRIDLRKSPKKSIQNKTELTNLVQNLMKKELQRISDVSQSNNKKVLQVPDINRFSNIYAGPPKNPTHKRAKSDMGVLKITELIKPESKVINVKAENDKEMTEMISHKCCSRLTSRRCSNAGKPAITAEVMEIIQEEEEKKQREEKFNELSTKETIFDREVPLSSLIKLNDIISQDREKLIKYNELYIAKHKSIHSTTLDYYKFVKLIGKGAFGKVTLGIHKLTGKYVAIKSIEKSYMKDEFSRKKVFREVYIMKKIRHANVIRLLEVFESTNHLLIVMEYAGGGDLLQYVKKHKKLKEEEAKGLFRQIVYGLGHIHSRSVIHRDIKLDNILLDSDHGVKICDFGVSKIMDKVLIIKEQCGTPAYISPEIISEKGYKGFFADYWSLGVLLYALLYGHVPFKADNMEDLNKLIRNGVLKFPGQISEGIKYSFY